MSEQTVQQWQLAETVVERTRMGTRAKRVLVVAFDFPPRRTSGVYRMVGFAKSLPELGWQPTVLTIRGLDGDQDPQLLEKLAPEVRIERTRYFSVNGWEDSAWKTAKKAGIFRAAPDDLRETALDRCLRMGGKILRSALYFPDTRAGWIPFAFARAVQLHREQKFDLVYTTSPPRTTQVIGMLMKRMFGLPWVSEYIDPWYPADGWLRRNADDRLLGHFTRTADRVVVVVPGHEEQLQQQYHVPPEKIAVVRNGFFEEDFASLESTPRRSLEPGLVHLGHFGTVYPGNEGSFFPALKNLLNRHPWLKTRLRLHVVGAASAQVLQDVQQDGLRDITEIHGFLPHVEALQLMRACHCLLLFWGRRDFSRLAVAGKTYEYLRMGLPILAVTSEGGVKDLVQSAGAGWVVPPDDIEAMQGALMQVVEMKNHAEHASARSAEFISQFRWDRQARILAKTFNEAWGHAR